MPVGRIGHVAHAGQVEIPVEVLLNFGSQVAQVHVAVQLGGHNVRSEIQRRAGGRLRNLSAQRIKREGLIVLHQYHVSTAERAIERIQVGARDVGFQVALHAQIAAGIEAQRREVGPAQVQRSHFVGGVAGVAQVHHGLEVEVQVGVVFAAGGDDVAVAVEGDGSGHPVVGVAVVAGTLHVGFHLAHQRGRVFQIAGSIDAPGGRDAAQLRIFQQLAKIKPAHREGAQQRLPAIGLRRPQLAAEREVAVR